MKAKSISFIDMNDEKILGKEMFNRVELNPEYKEYKTEEDKKSVKSKALYFYNNIVNSDLRYPMVSYIKAINYYNVYYNTMNTVLPNGTHINDVDCVFELEIECDPNYYKLFTEELNKLAKEDEVYVNLTMFDDQEWGDKTICGRSLTKEEFMEKYNISLDEYYDAISMKYNVGANERETAFRKKLAQIKLKYFEYLIADVDKGFDRYDIEMDGYISYLQLVDEFKDVENKEEILNEYGFEFDNNNHLLIFKTSEERLSLV